MEMKEHICVIPIKMCLGGEKAKGVVLKLFHLFARFLNFLHTRAGYKMNKLWIIPCKIAISMRDSHGFIHFFNIPYPIC